MILLYVAIGSGFAIYNNQYILGNWEYKGRYKKEMEEIKDEVAMHPWLTSVIFLVVTIFWPLSLIPSGMFGGDE